MREGLWDEGRRAWTRLLAWLPGADGPAARGPSGVDALADITLLRQLLAQAETAAVKAARREGRSWSEIAASVGMSRQSAWERWRDLDTPGPDEAAAPDTAEDPAARTEGVEQALDVAADDLLDALLDGPPEVRVPDVVAVAWPRAQQVLRAAGLVAVIVDPVDFPAAVPAPEEWHVVEQKPAAGGLLARGSAISLWLSRGPGSAGVREPRRLPPDPSAGRGARDETADEPVG